MTIRYVAGDATDPQGQGPIIIAHVVNDQSGWGAGFVAALSRRQRDPEFAYRRWAGQTGTAAARASAGDPEFALGQVQFVALGQERWVANMLAQHGYRSAENRQPLDYRALARCLLRVAKFARAQRASVHMPRIGTGLGGGDWSVILSILGYYLKDIPIVVYTLPASQSGDDADA